jgi:outer membrane protein OmpA-like peptidoglycan-associated protein
MKQIAKRAIRPDRYGAILCRLICLTAVACLMALPLCARQESEPPGQETGRENSDRNRMEEAGSEDWDEAENDSLPLAQYLADARPSHEVSVWASAGVSSLHYRPNTGKAVAGRGYAFGVGYTRNLVGDWSLSAGAEYACYRREMEVADIRTAYGTDDADGNPIEYRSQVDAYRERQRAGYLNIPVSAARRMGKNGRYYASLGVKAGIPVSGRYTGSGRTLTTSGYYTAYRQEEIWQNDLGYGSFPVGTQEKPLKLKVAYSGTLEAGRKWNIGIGTDLYAALCLDYGFNTVIGNRGKENFVAYNYENPAAPLLNGLTASGYGNPDNRRAFMGKVAPVAVGIKLKLHFAVGCGDLLTDRKRYKDMRQASPWDKEQERENRKRYLALAYDDSDEPVPNTEKKQKATEENTKKTKSDSVSSQPETVITDTPVEIKGTGIGACHCDAVHPSEPPIDHYRLGQTAMSAPQKALLDEYVLLLEENLQTRIDITGHTCDIGSEQVNLRTGQKRADRAKDYLISRGISPERISTYSKGETEPLVPNTGKENRSKNRRLEIRISNK